MGLILVFDMDQTILDSSDPYLFNRPPTPEARVILKGKIREALNWNVVNIMKRAAALRPGGVAAICLLTNNSSEILVSAVDEVLHEDIGSTGKYRTYKNESAKSMPDKPYFFDAIMMRQHPSREQIDNPPKRLQDIQIMLEPMGLWKTPISSIFKDIFFFDDIGDHALYSDFQMRIGGQYKNNYIQIVPPFNKYIVDTTDYSSILTALNKLDGEPAELPPPPRAPPVRTAALPSAPPRQPMFKRYNTPNNQGKLPSAAPLPPTPYRARSNARVNENNLGLPPPPQEQSIRKKSTLARPSLLGAFAPPSSAATGGSRKTRSRKRRFTRRKIL
jgi:hypothetical protein